MAQSEMKALRVAIAAPSVAGRLTRLRMLLVAVEGDPKTASKRFCDQFRKQLNLILKSEGQDNENLATAARLALRLDRVDPWRKRKKKLAEAEAAKPQPSTPLPSDDELARRMRMYEEGAK